MAGLGMGVEGRRKTRKIWSEMDDEGGRGGRNFNFVEGQGGGGRGATLYPYIYNIFLYDISLLIIASNRLVSHLNNFSSSVTIK